MEYGPSHLMGTSTEQGGMRRTRRPAYVPPQDMARGRVLLLTEKVWLTVRMQGSGSQTALSHQETRIMEDYRGT